MTHSLALTLLAGPLNGDGIRRSTPVSAADESARAAERAAEQVLIEQVRSGDAEAFRSLVVAYFERISRFAFGFVGDRETAEDVAQDVFAQIWAKHVEWRPHTSMRAYLYGAARNRALNVLKHRDVEARYAGVAVDTGNDDVAPGADVELEASLVIATLRQAVRELPERRRVALALRYEQGLSHAEVGETLGISAKASKELIARTIEVLRERLRALR